MQRDDGVKAIIQDAALGVLKELRKCHLILARDRRSQVVAFSLPDHSVVPKPGRCAPTHGG